MRRRAHMSTKALRCGVRGVRAALIAAAAAASGACGARVGKVPVNCSGDVVALCEEACASGHEASCYQLAVLYSDPDAREARDVRRRGLGDPLVVARRIATRSCARGHLDSCFQRVRIDSRRELSSWRAVMAIDSLCEQGSPMACEDSAVLHNFRPQDRHSTFHDPVLAAAMARRAVAPLRRRCDAGEDQACSALLSSCGILWGATRGWSLVGEGDDALRHHCEGHRLPRLAHPTP